MASIGYIGLLLFLTFYVCGIMGISLFRDNDPWHFGNLELTLMTLVRGEAGFEPPTHEATSTLAPPPPISTAQNLTHSHTNTGPTTPTISTTPITHIISTTLTTNITSTTPTSLYV